MSRGKSTTTPTAAEAEWMAAISAYGCVVCRLQGRGYVPAAVHHLLSGGRRRGHLDTIPLCDRSAVAGMSGSFGYVSVTGYLWSSP